jgi:hypothetical protein
MPNKEQIEIPAEILHWIEGEVCGRLPYVYDDDAHALSVDAKRHLGREIAKAMYRHLKSFPDQGKQEGLSMTQIRALINGYNKYIETIAEETALLRKKVDEFYNQCYPRDYQLEKQAAAREVLGNALAPFISSQKSIPAP